MHFSLGEPLLVREAKQQAALPHSCDSEDQQLDVDRVIVLRVCVSAHDGEEYTE